MQTESPHQIQVIIYHVEVLYFKTYFPEDFNRSPVQNLNKQVADYLEELNATSTGRTECLKLRT